MKHKHYDLIVAWANGEPVQHYSEKDNKWIDNTRPTWSLECEWRIKPKEEFLKYKVALFRYHSGEYSGEFFVDVYEPKNYEEMERAHAFVMWLGEEQTVNVGWLQK